MKELIDVVGPAWPALKARTEYAFLKSSGQLIDWADVKFGYGADAKGAVSFISEAPAPYNDQGFVMVTTAWKGVKHEELIEGALPVPEPVTDTGWRDGSGNVISQPVDTGFLPPEDRGFQAAGDKIDPDAYLGTRNSQARFGQAPNPTPGAAAAALTSRQNQPYVDEDGRTHAAAVAAAERTAANIDQTPGGSPGAGLTSTSPASQKSDVESVDPTVGLDITGRK